MTKKLLILIAIVIAGFYGYSQSLSLSHEGTPLEPGEVFTVHGEASNDEMVVEFDVTNNSGGNIAVLVKKVENYLVDGSENTFCWGLCFPPFVYQSPNSIVINAGATNDVDFSGHYNPKTNPGESSIDYVFFDENNPDDSVSVTVIYTTLNTGIDDVFNTNSLSNAYPNPANNFVYFDYDIQVNQETTMRIYSLVGSLVNEYTITQGYGTMKVETARLEEGFYFYTLTSGNEEVKSGKFVVKH